MLRALLFSVILALPLSAHAAEDPRVISWDDLVPQFDPIDNPFDRLEPDVLDDIGTIIRAQEDLELNFITKDSAEYQNALELERKLMENGVDFKGLMLAAEELQKEVDRRNSSVVPDLNGKVVRMPGYALPLEQSPDGTTEFLLVPYVGACIHTPPPPPNQIVYVKLATAYKVASLYEAIWITGRMSTEAATRNLNFVDGEAPIENGYRLDGITIEPYK